jgi:isoleucyl-tRNA synthetase
VGIVHTAPAFGEDDYWTCRNNNIPLVNPVDAKGRFMPEITDFYEEDTDKTVIDMNPVIIRFLYANGKGVADGTIEHNYPHCWRCKRPLIYKAMDAYYFDIGKVKDRLIEHNESINWVPDTIKHGRFGNWLAGARDWNISRNRYWSTPIPIWNCDCCGETKVLGSVEEIYQASGVRLDNLHRQFMDKVTFKCDKCDGTMTRVPEVLDCWFESGSVPFAQKHYPFENKEWFDEHFPCDFIVEYTGQIRCWFYYLHVLAVALFDKPAFKNCIVHGTILAKDGKKLSKSSKNYTDPMELMKKYGTDAFRLYLYQTDAMLIGDLKFDESKITESLTKLIFPFWNACNFFISYANIDGFQPSELKAPTTNNQLDRWMLAKLYTETNRIKANMDAYQVDKYVDSLRDLIEGLTNWYIRRSRRRFWGSCLEGDKLCAFETLYYVLVNMCKLLAPVAPILAEEMYRILTNEDSVHLADWPEIPEEFRNDALVGKLDTVQLIIFLGRSIRSKNNVMNRQPLTELKVALPNKQLLEDMADFTDVIAEELNVKRVELLSDVGDIATVKYDPDFNEIRNNFPTKVGDMVRAIKSGAFRLEGEQAVLTIGGSEETFPASVIQVKYLAKDGLFVASDKGIVATLDLTITEELRQEGMARQIVRHIQDERKKQNYAIADRVQIQILEGNVPEQWVEYICGETLSRLAEIQDPDGIIELAEDGIKIAIKK